MQRVVVRCSWGSCNIATALRPCRRTTYYHGVVWDERTTYYHGVVWDERALWHLRPAGSSVGMVTRGAVRQRGW